MKPDGLNVEAENEQEVEPSRRSHIKQSLESKRATCWKGEGFHQDRARGGE